MSDWVFIDAAAYQRAFGFGFIIAVFVAFAGERFPPVMIAVVGAGAIIVSAGRRGRTALSIGASNAKPRTLAPS